MNKKDARVVRTRQALYDAFIRLVTENGYETLIIQDLVDEAGVSHKTFYRHYADKEALFSEIVGDSMGQIQDLVQTSGTDLASLEENTRHFYRWAEKHQTFLAMLIKIPPAINPLTAFKDLAITEGKRVFANTGIPEEIVGEYFASTQRALSSWWLESGMPYPPAEMADYVNKLLIRPLKLLAK